MLLSHNYSHNALHVLGQAIVANIQETDIQFVICRLYYSSWYSWLVIWYTSLLWRHNGRDGVSNHQPNNCLLNRSFRPRSKKTSKLRVTGLCAGNIPVNGEFPAQRASNAENVSIWWRHHVTKMNTKVVTVTRSHYVMSLPWWLSWVDDTSHDTDGWPRISLLG